jgi:hypothetical protein
VSTAGALERSASTRSLTSQLRRSKPMPAPVMRPSLLRDHPDDPIRFACRKCSRSGQYRKASLIERYGPDEDMTNLRLKVAAGCPRRIENRILDLCRIYYPDLAGRPSAKAYRRREM